MSKCIVKTVIYKKEITVYNSSKEKNSILKCHFPIFSVLTNWFGTYRIEQGDNLFLENSFFSHIFVIIARNAQYLRVNQNDRTTIHVIQSD